jgi:Tat protein translocase TatB subunit
MDIGIGFWEIILILVIGLIVLGPGKAVEFARSLGRLSRNLKKLSTDFTSTVTKELDIEEDNPDKTHFKLRDTDIKTSNTITPGDTSKTSNHQNDDPAAQS